MRASGCCALAATILLLALFSTAPAHAEQNWSVQIVDDRAAIRNGLSITVDSNDTPHMVYINSENGYYYLPGSGAAIINQQYLMYASLNSSGWNIQPVDAMDRTEWRGSIGVVSYSALAFDHIDNPHIVYRSLDRIKYAAWTGANWSIQIVDHGNDGSLALDSTGNPHISYVGEKGELKYASLTGTNWNIQIIDPEPNIPQFDTDFQYLALDSDDRASVVYSVNYGVGSTINWASGDSSGWTIRTAVSNANLSRLGNVVVDSHGYPRFTYNNGWNHSLMYERWNGNAWIGQTATIIGDSTGFLRLDSNDNPHLTYDLQADSLNVKYARWKWSRWDVQTVAGANIFAYPTPFALDPKGNPHIGYMNIRNTNSPDIQGGTVMYATCDQLLQTFPADFLLPIFSLVLAALIIGAAAVIVYLWRKK